MKKSDLKTGMRVVTRDGDTFIVIKDYQPQNYEHQDVFFVNSYTFMNGEDFNEDLMYMSYDNTLNDDEDCDIVEVHDKTVDGWFLKINEKGRLLWKRKEPKEMTLADIEKELGYPVKIVE